MEKLRACLVAWAVDRRPGMEVVAIGADDEDSDAVEWTGRALESFRPGSARMETDSAEQDEVLRPLLEDLNRLVPPMSAWDAVEIVPASGEVLVTVDGEVQTWGPDDRRPMRRG
ncbi:hypothetical protein AB0A05_27245 [Streptomyces sp. NPDC046374]|uniref:hypothetical protein n=1 Tax=Streptomyces sp. NPDC046374 TaxID=3154917 RepID=UPI0033FD55D0